MAGRLAVESDCNQYATEYRLLERCTDRELPDRLKIAGFNYTI